VHIRVRVCWRARARNCVRLRVGMALDLRVLSSSPSLLPLSISSSLSTFVSIPVHDAETPMYVEQAPRRREAVTVSG
jgi:hypothetical protein